MELLQQLYTFYSGRYQGTELETKFNAACDELINARDITQPDYIKFCIAKNVEPIIRKVAKPVAPSSGFRGGC
jgi:hypothetical protein